MIYDINETPITPTNINKSIEKSFSPKERQIKHARKSITISNSEKHKKIAKIKQIYIIRQKFTKGPT